jgi:uncharacterized membrane protein
MKWTKVRKWTAGAIGALVISFLSWLAKLVFPQTWPEWLTWFQALAVPFNFIRSVMLGSIALPVWAMLLASIGLAAGAIAYVRRQRTAQKSVVQDRENEIRRLSKELVRQRSETEGWKSCSSELTRQLNELKDPPEPAVAASFAPTDNQRRMLRFLIAKHPHAKSLKELAENSRYRTPAHAEQELDSMVDAGIVSTNRFPGGVYYKLTKAGRDAAIEWTKTMPPHSEVDRY